MMKQVEWFSFYSAMKHSGSGTRALNMTVTGGVVGYHTDGNGRYYYSGGTPITAGGGFKTTTYFNEVTKIINIAGNKKLIFGDFTIYNGTPINRIARLNSDGTLDNTFTPGEGANSSIISAAIQSDGKIIIVGAFNEYNGYACSGIARLDSNGIFDTTYRPTLSSTSAVAVISNVAIQTDDKAVVIGIFSHVGSTARSRIARLNTNGTLDTGFAIGTGITGNGPGGGGDPNTEGIIIQSDGKIVVCGLFTTYNGTSRGGIVRINTDGSIDTGFDPGTGIGTQHGKALALQTDGKIIMVGNFSTYNGTTRNRIVRINTNGSIDTGFAPSSGFNFTAYDVKIQSDGKILVVGDFTTYNGTARNRIVRINTDSTIDTGFVVGTGCAGNATNFPTIARTVELEGTNVLIGGLFNTYNANNVYNICRTNSSGSYDATFTMGTGAQSAALKEWRFFIPNYKTRITSLTQVNVGLPQGILAGVLDLSEFSFFTNLYIVGNGDGSGFQCTCTNILFPTPDPTCGPWTNMIYFANNGLTSIDISMCTNLGGNVNFSRNEALSSITLPVQGANSSNITTYSFRNCALTGNHDASGIVKLGGIIELYSNSALTLITWPATLDSGANNITRYIISACNLTGTHNASSLVKMGGDIQLQTNPNLTSITWPTTLDSGTDNISVYNIYSCNLTGNHDASMMVKMGGIIQLQVNPNLTSVAWPATLDSGTNNITQYNLDRCNLTGNHDASMMVKMGGNIRLYSNSLLTSVTWPTTLDSGTDNITFYWISSCNLTGTHNASSLLKIGGNIQLQINSNLTSITWPTTLDSSTDNITVYYTYNCNLTGTHDISMFTQLGGDIRMYSNAALTTITLPSSIINTARAISFYWAYSTALSGSLNLSVLTNLGGLIKFKSQPSITSIILPTCDELSVTASVSTTTLTVTAILSGSNIRIGQYIYNGGTGLATITAFGTGTGGIGTYTISTSLTIASTTLQIGYPLTGFDITNTTITSLDLSGFKRLNKYNVTNYSLGATLYLGNNTSLSTITWPTTAIDRSVAIIDMSNCALTGTLDLSWVQEWTTPLFNVEFSIGTSFSNMTGLTAVTWPASIKGWSINFSGCSLNITFPIGDVITINYTNSPNGIRTINLNNNAMSTANVDATIDKLFNFRGNHQGNLIGGIGTTLAKIFTIAGSNAAPSGTYAMPTTGYTGSIHAASEATLDAASAGWTQKEKIWVLVNLQVSVADTRKRYNWTITTS